jgi:hypothetical protein
MANRIARADGLPLIPLDARSGEVPGRRENAAMNATSGLLRPDSFWQVFDFLALVKQIP